MLRRQRGKQAGLTLIELMISIGLGITAMSAITVFYITTFSSSADTLKASQLSQEISSLMALMVQDIRRAGAVQQSADFDPADNPFNVGKLRLKVYEDDGTGWAEPSTDPEQGSGACIVYAYDLDLDGTVDYDTEVFGFRLKDGAVQMGLTGLSAAPTGCGSGSWEDMTDVDSYTVDSLTFDLADSKCVNASEPNGEDDNSSGANDEGAEYDCYDTPDNAADTGELKVLVRHLTITISASWNGDSSISAELQQQLRVRNDVVEVAL